MNYRKNEIRAGAFIIVCILVLIVFLMAISGSECSKETYFYSACFKYIGGITKGSLVRYGGLEVGRVEDIRFPERENETGIELVLEVDKETPIKTDSEAFLTTIGFMGSYYVEITLGTPQAARLQPNQTIRSVDITPFSQMAGTAGQISARIEVFLDRLNDLLNAENRQAISTFVQSTSAMMSQGNGNMVQLLDNLNTLSVQLTTTVETMRGLIEANEPAIAEGIRDLPEVLEQTKCILNNLEHTTGNLDKMVASNGDAYSDIVDRLQRSTLHLEEFSRTIKERPWTLIRKSAPSERKVPD